VTLYQILDLYLRLCRNDGTNEPDALYLTLSSKRAFSDEILELNAAAIAGKTLSELHSELHSWDEYDEAELGSEEDHEANGPKEHEDDAEEHEDELYYADEAQKEDTSRETEPVAGPEGEEASAQAQVTSQPEIVRTQDEDESTSGEGAPESAAESAPHATQPQSEELEQHEEFRDNQASEYDHGHGDPTEEQYDSDGPHSDSTATVAGLTRESEIKESIHDTSTEVAHVGTDQNDNENHYEVDHASGELEAGECYEHEHISPYEDPEVSQGDITVGETGDAETQEHDDQVSVLDEGDADELDAPPTNEIVPAVSLQDENTSQDQTARLLHGELQGASDTKEKTPEPADDLLGSAEDLLQNPPRVTGSDTLDHFEGIDYDEPEDESAAPAAAEDEGADEQEFDENENHFGDYDTYVEETETVELVGADPSLTDSPNNNLSSKRSREDEDDWDLEEPTLESKRRRPS
jgi:hypothetical protein